MSAMVSVSAQNRSFLAGRYECGVRQKHLCQQSAALDIMWFGDGALDGLLGGLDVLKRWESQHLQMLRLLGRRTKKGGAEAPPLRVTNR
jgi:hypothetical protein